MHPYSNLVSYKYLNGKINLITNYQLATLIGTTYALSVHTGRPV